MQNKLAMIKLSVFMLDPVKAYELYTKEIIELRTELDEKTESHKELKKQYKILKDTLKSKNSTISVVEKKLAEDRLCVK